MANDYATEFRIIAVGYFFAAANFAINGYELFLPDSIGYLLICIACVDLSHRYKFLKLGILIAAILSFVSIAPGCRREATGRGGNAAGDGT